MELIFRHYEAKTLAELVKLDDKLVKKLAVLNHKCAVIQQRVAGLKVAQRKPKGAKK